MSISKGSPIKDTATKLKAEMLLIKDTATKLKAEMLLSNFQEHTKGVQQRIVELLLGSGLTRPDLSYFIEYKKWPNEATIKKSVHPDPLQGYTETVTRYSKREKTAARNLIIIACFLFILFFVSVFSVIFLSDDSSKKAVNTIPTEQTTQPVKDGNSL
jgi:hypothetical protein